MFKNAFVLHSGDIADYNMRYAMDEWGARNCFTNDSAFPMYRGTIVDALDMEVFSRYDPEVESGLRHLLLMMREHSIEKFYYHLSY